MPILTVGELTLPPGMVNVPWIVRRLVDTYLGGGDFEDVEDGGYQDIHVYMGRLRESNRERYDVGQSTERGMIAVTRKILFFDKPNLDIREEDLMVEGVDDGSGVVTPKPNGQTLIPTNVRFYDFMTQVDCKDKE